MINFGCLILMTKVLIVSNTYSAYGAEKILLWLGRTLAEDEQYDIEYVSFFDENKSLEVGYHSVSHELKIPCQGSILRRYYNYFILGYKRLHGLFRNNKYDYVISFGQYSYYLLLSLRHKFGYKIILSERNDPYFSKPFVGVIKKKLYGLADKIVFQTIGARNFFLNCKEEKISIIPNPIDIPAEKWQIDKAKKSIINVARLNIYPKRQDLLLKAFKELLKTHSDYVLEFCGDGQDRALLETMVSDLGIKDHVFFYGKVKPIEQYLLAARVFVLTSDSEGIPNALMEAMALGMPVISTRCSPGGAELLIADHVSGILVDKGDAQNLFRSMSDLIDNPDVAVRLGENARSSMYEYNSDRIISMWKSILC